ncbi:DNA polymerase III subunit delta [Tychonema sp. LEGE 07203]|uniref:DNA polymerase III subunit delta n=1 Tax=Tychonema sp. LEGE 07203 TaxID=1828671 RepID=UPI001883020A|nr:DNA polymerase III subunit delta [Tychonema sp. LEGE 07203]MBE9094902.1 DNA polymerase III subunit delta [Tychonema sp. LEGE 07203]
MQFYLFWGEDDFAISQAVTSLRSSVLDPNWASFNYDKIIADRADAVVEGLDRALTPPFGTGSRFVWLANTTVTQQCSPELLAELERTLPVIPPTTVLLLTSVKKPDSRLKSTKLLNKYGEFREFSPIPPWNDKELAQRARQVAGEMNVKLTATAIELLVESIGSDTRQLYSELEKLRLFAGNRSQPLNPEEVAALVHCHAQNTFQLADAIREGNTGAALELLAGLAARNEPGLRIVAGLTGKFRIWLWVKAMIAAGDRDDKIARALDLGNPKRIYYFRQEVKNASLEKLQKSLPLLLELEASLKRGREEISTLQTKVIELSSLFR